MTYTIRDPERFKTLKSQHAKGRSRCKSGFKSLFLVSGGTDLSAFPYDAQITFSTPLWEIWCKDEIDEKDKEIVAESLDSIAYM